MPKPAEKPQQPKFPPLKKRCKYCHVTFSTPPTYNGQQQDFCVEAHRKAFHKEGRKPIAAILKRQEKHMRKIVREELNSVDWFQFVQALTKENHPMREFLLSSQRVLPIRTEPGLAARP